MSFLMSRKGLALVLVLAMLSLVLVACEGKQGPSGPPGPTGPAGAAGPAGSAGVRGPEGPAGPAGAAGPVGPAGAAGVAGAAGAAGKTGPSQPTSIVVTPNSVVTGGTFNIAGSGLQPGEGWLAIMVAAIAGSDLIMSGGDANASGAFESIGRVAAGLNVAKPGVNPGVYTVRVIGTKGSVASAPIIVTAPPTPTPTPRPTATPTAVPK